MIFRPHYCYVYYVKDIDAAASIVQEAFEKRTDAYIPVSYSVMSGAGLVHKYNEEDIMVISFVDSGPRWTNTPFRQFFFDAECTSHAIRQAE